MRGFGTFWGCYKSGAPWSRAGSWLLSRSLDSKLLGFLGTIPFCFQDSIVMVDWSISPILHDWNLENARLDISETTNLVFPTEVRPCKAIGCENVLARTVSTAPLFWGVPNWCRHGFVMTTIHQFAVVQLPVVVECTGDMNHWQIQVTSQLISQFAIVDWFVNYLIYSVSSRTILKPVANVDCDMIHQVLSTKSNQIPCNVTAFTTPLVRNIQEPAAINPYKPLFTIVAPVSL